jgi:hypothetical protein
MGQEARCSVRIGDRLSEGKALLETDELVFRGDDGLRLKIPFKEMKSIEAPDGELRVETPDGRAVFELGVQAEKWAQKILNPPSLLDKLGVKAGMRVLVLGVEDEGFLSDLRERTDGVNVGEASSSARPFDSAQDRPTNTSGRAGRDVDAGTDGELFSAVFVAIDGPPDLDQLAELKSRIKPDGAVWAVFRKGRKDFNENDVLRGGLAAGLVDVKVVRFSDTHTASKFVIRKAERGR